MRNIHGETHPSLRFPVEKESHSSFSFLKDQVEKCSSKFITSIYRKPTFTGQFIRWNSFSPQKRKTNLILTQIKSNLFHQKV